MQMSRALISKPVWEEHPPSPLKRGGDTEGTCWRKKGIGQVWRGEDVDGVFIRSLLLCPEDGGGASEAAEGWGDVWVGGALIFQ